RRGGHGWARGIHGNRHRTLEGFVSEESSAMCDYSLHHVKSRPAKVGDKLRTVNTGTRGFASPDDRTTAVCVLPGTELAFAEKVKCGHAPFSLVSWRAKTKFRTAIFRQVNKDVPRMHHDALEFPNGQTVLLTELVEGQEATMLQLPAQQQNHAVLCAELCRRLFHRLLPPPAKAREVIIGSARACFRRSFGRPTSASW